MTPKLAITTAVLGTPTALVIKCVASMVSTCTDPFGYNVLERLTLFNDLDNNLGVTGSLQWCYEHTTAPIIAFLHSDLEILEPGWDERVLREFDDPKVGVVGFGGGRVHGHADVYKTPYSLTQLARGGYVSNVVDAESHGQRFSGSCEVAVLDGFCLVIRRGLLDSLGGWPVASLPFHSYDYFACIATHKLGYRVRMVGVHCQHHGGATSTTPQYQEWSQRQLGKTDAQVHEESHRWIYEYGRGWLPWRCP